MLMWSKHPSFNCLIHFYTIDRYFVGNSNIAIWYVGNVDIFISIQEIDILLVMVILLYGMLEMLIRLVRLMVKVLW